MKGLSYMTRIILDAFGGDNAPLSILQGCEIAAEETDAEITVCGDTAKIRDCAEDNGVNLANIRIMNAPDIFEMDDEPGEIIKSKKNTSMAVGLAALAAGNGDAFISAGSTGALTIGATFIVKRIRGIKRVAIGTILPSNEGPYMLIDCGANAECRPEMLYQFGLMGDVYMKKIMKRTSPKVALLNIGTEDTKGDTLRQEAFEMMRGAGYNFIGNVEARTPPYGGCDVLVADGFAGNIYLKLTEGLAGAMLQNIKEIFSKSVVSKLAASMVMGGLRAFKKKMDYSEYGGALLLGCAKPVIKIHGSANAKNVKLAVLQAVDCVENGVVEEIAKGFESGKTDD